MRINTAIKLLILSLIWLLVVWPLHTGATFTVFTDVEESTGNTIRIADDWGEIDACITVFPGFCCGCLCPPIIVAITLPYDSGHTASEIDIDSVTLHHNGESVRAMDGTVFKHIFSCCNPCCPPCGCCETLLVSFDRDAVDEILHDCCGKDAPLFFTGSLESGECFFGSSDVFVKHCSRIEYDLVQASVEFIPDAFNISDNESISCLIQLPEAYNISDAVNSSFLIANHNFISTQPESIEIADHNSDGIADMLASLNRGDMEMLLHGLSGNVMLQLSGTLKNDDIFSGIATINVSNSDMPEPTPTPTPESERLGAPLITYPVNNSTVELPGPSSINGTAGFYSDITEIRLQILDVENSIYWNGSSWITILEWSDAPAATGTSNWSYIDLPLWINGSYYQIVAWITNGTYANESEPVLFGVGPASIQETKPTSTPTPEPPLEPMPTPAPTPTPEPTFDPTPTPAPEPTTTPESTLIYELE